MLETIATIISLVIGISGFIFAYIEHKSKLRMQTIVKTHLLALLNRQKMIVPNSSEIDLLVKDINNKDLLKWIWATHQGLSDLYVMQVGYYLTFEKKFTYDDLKKMIGNKQIPGAWEEGIWRDLISRRDENIDSDIPEFFSVVENLSDSPHTTKAD